MNVVDLQAPGVYYEHFDASAPAVSAIRTDVAGFVGISRRGPLDTPVPLQSFRQFRAHFGDFTGNAYLAYCVRAFFENGGRRCWVVRVASKDKATGATNAAATIAGSTGEPVWRITASSPGAWGNRLTVSITPTPLAQTLIDHSASTPQAAKVASVTGFVRGSMVRLSQAGSPDLWRVVSKVDAAHNRLYWVHPEPGLGLPYDRQLTGIDANLPMHVESVEYTLLVHDQGRRVGRFPGLSLVPENERYGPRALPQPEYPLELEAARGIPAAPAPVMIEALTEPGSQLPDPLDVGAGELVSLTGGRDGLGPLTTIDFVGEAVAPDESDIVKDKKRRGLRALEQVDEVAMVAVPDILVRPAPEPVYAPLPAPEPDPCLPSCDPEPGSFHPTSPSVTSDAPPVFTDQQIHLVQAALVQHCEEQRNRIALLESPFTAAADQNLGAGAIRSWRARFESKYAALYFPWVRVVDPLGAGLTRDVPPSGHVAGHYARTDTQVGVHKAPANQGALEWAEDVTVKLDGEHHGVLNHEGINLIRPERGRGLRIMGARTVSSDPDWRYVNVRRLMMMISKAVDLSTQWAAFEPNDASTRSKITLALHSFLRALWEQGALVGDAPEQGFVVICNEDNNPPRLRELGQLIAEVGVAPAVPYEFVLLRVGRTGNALEITEAGLRKRDG